MSLVAGIAACASVAESPRSSSAEDGKARWHRLLVEESAWPADKSVRELALELASFAASPDPALRDEIGYEVSARWITAGRLSVPDLRELMHVHLANLHVGLGQGESDGVFLRSFCALHLSLLIARDKTQPFLEEADVQTLVSAVAKLLREERDRRGWVEGKGWAHPIAHAADAAKFLARQRFLDTHEAAELFAALESGLEGPNAWGENDRLAAAMQSLSACEEFDPAEFDARCIAWIPEASAVWQAVPFDAQLFRRTENRKQFLRALYVRLCSDPKPTERVTLIAERALETLERMP